MHQVRSITWSAESIPTSGRWDEKRVKADATNAALLAIAILANSRPELKQKLREFRAEQEKKVREAKLD
jgi:phosphoribosylcarboxyaminoimidazole (NCAIR) mutase